MILKQFHLKKQYWTAGWHDSAKVKLKFLTKSDVQLLFYDFRQGQMCSRCLRSLDRNGDDFSLSLCDEPEDDDSSMLDALCNDSSPAAQHRSSFTMDVQVSLNRSVPAFQTALSSLFCCERAGVAFVFIFAWLVVVVLAAMFVSQEKTELQDILRREVSLIWMMPAPTLLSIIIDLCLYLKEQYIVPYLYRPLRIPFILLHYCLKHKVHWKVCEVRKTGEALW